MGGYKRACTWVPAPAVCNTGQDKDSLRDSHVNSTEVPGRWWTLAWDKSNHSPAPGVEKNMSKGVALTKKIRIWEVFTNDVASQAWGDFFFFFASAISYNPCQVRAN